MVTRKAPVRKKKTSSSSSQRRGASKSKEPVSSYSFFRPPVFTLDKRYRLLFRPGIVKRHTLDWLKSYMETHQVNDEKVKKDENLRDDLRKTLTNTFINLFTETEYTLRELVNMTQKEREEALRGELREFRFKDMDVRETKRRIDLLKRIAELASTENMGTGTYYDKDVAFTFIMKDLYDLLSTKFEQVVKTVDGFIDSEELEEELIATPTKKSFRTLFSTPIAGYISDHLMKVDDYTIRLTIPEILLVYIENMAYSPCEDLEKATSMIEKQALVAACNDFKKYVSKSDSRESPNYFARYLFAFLYKKWKQVKYLHDNVSPRNPYEEIVVNPTSMFSAFRVEYVDPSQVNPPIILGGRVVDENPLLLQDEIKGDLVEQKLWFFEIKLVDTFGV